MMAASKSAIESNANSEANADAKSEVKSEVKYEYKFEIKPDVKYEYLVKDNPYSMGNAIRSLLLFGLIVFVLAAVGIF